MQPRALSACRDLDLDDTARPVARPSSGFRYNCMTCGLVEIWNSTKRHTKWLWRVLELDETTRLGVSLCSRTRRNDMLRRFPVFQNTRDRHAMSLARVLDLDRAPRRATWHVLEPDTTTCHVTCSGSGSHNGRSKLRVYPGLASPRHPNDF